MSSRCPDCGQMMSSDAGERCERCERLERVSELEAEVERLRPKAHIHDRIRQLIALGLSPAQALDVAFVEDAGLSPQQWAEQRGVSPPAVYNNIADAEGLYKPQAELGDFPLDELSEQELQNSNTDSGNADAAEQEEI